MSVGFIHGVMNTDNMAISGETIDYGPCAFMDEYHPDTLFSSIDQQGRYAYSNQPRVAPWNLAQLANSLLPLMGDEYRAIADATQAIDQFTPQYDAHWLRLFGRKIGIAKACENDRALVDQFLDGLTKARADFTNSFRGLSDGTVPNGMEDWRSDWQARLGQETGDTKALMRAANPAFIPRNHRIEAMIQAAVSGDLEPVAKLSAVLAHPFDDQPENAEFRVPPAPNEVVHQTFCGT